MKVHDTKSARRLVANIPAVLEAWSWELTDWAKKAGITYRALRYYIDIQRSPGLDVLDKLAEAAGIEVIDLLSPKLTAKMVRERAASRLLENFTAAEPAEQEYAVHVLERSRRPRRA